MLVFSDLFVELHGVIRGHMDIRTRMQLRRVSRWFHAQDRGPHCTGAHDTPGATGRVTVPQHIGIHYRNDAP